jgi:transcriptional regulator with XRE-family HTH domain
MKLETYIKANTTVSDFANRIGKSRAQVHRYMRGENLSKGVIEMIALATDNEVPPSSFFEAETEEHAA